MQQPTSRLHKPTTGDRRSSQVSAGLLVFRKKSELQVLLAHPGGPFWVKKDAGAWGIPKGQVERGGDFISTAQREFTEETGFVATGPFIPLSPVKQRSGKTVHAWACAGDFDPDRITSNVFEIEWPPKSGRLKSFPEIDRIGWFDLPTAFDKIIAYQRPFLVELQGQLTSPPL
jgi:predicted NUDIX family NTP pyrophosphohydrolase